MHTFYHNKWTQNLGRLDWGKLTIFLGFNENWSLDGLLALYVLRSIKKSAVVLVVIVNGIVILFGRFQWHKQAGNGKGMILIIKWQNKVRDLCVLCMYVWCMKILWMKEWRSTSLTQSNYAYIALWSTLHKEHLSCI